MTEKKEKVTAEVVTEVNKTTSKHIEVNDDLKTQIVMMHALGIMIGFVSPLIFLLIAEDKKLLKDHSKSALNWHISIAIYVFALVIISVILTIITFGIFSFIAPILFLVPLGLNIVFPVMGAVKASQDPKTVWKYPASIPFLKLDEKEVEDK